ncbi:MAG: hypothetical protein GY804_11525 [Alphaproteobacteria bacterium]|nr:hypothetical protein [Alphaproteobacteria bacterium]
MVLDQSSPKTAAATIVVVLLALAVLVIRSVFTYTTNSNSFNISKSAPLSTDPYIADIQTSNVSLDISHAVERHGVVIATSIRSACNTQKPPLWYNPETTYYARLCTTHDGRIGIQILRWLKEQWKEIITFHDNNVEIEAVEGYMVESGYIPEIPNPPIGGP